MSEVGSLPPSSMAPVWVARLDDERLVCSGASQMTNAGKEAVVTGAPETWPVPPGS